LLRERERKEKKEKEGDVVEGNERYFVIMGT